MILFPENQSPSYFSQGDEVGIVGRGETIEICFAEAARAMFALMFDLRGVNSIQIITFEFETENIEEALCLWLEALLVKAKEHQLQFADFRLLREGKRWKGTAAGQKWLENIEQKSEIKTVTNTSLSVKKKDHLWEATCVVK